jgi:hypothetical protein
MSIGCPFGLIILSQKSLYLTVNTLFMSIYFSTDNIFTPTRLY